VFNVIFFRLISWILLGACGAFQFSRVAACLTDKGQEGDHHHSDTAILQDELISVLMLGVKLQKKTCVGRTGRFIFDVNHVLSVFQNRTNNLHAVLHRM
jgi:hypothetical protein